MNDPELRGRLGVVEIPVLVIWGDSDDFHPRLWPRERRVVPERRFELIADAGDLPQLEQPAATLALIDDFLRRDERATPSDRRRTAHVTRRRRPDDRRDHRAGPLHQRSPPGSRFLARHLLRPGLTCFDPPTQRPVALRAPSEAGQLARRYAAWLLGLQRIKRLLSLLVWSSANTYPTCWIDFTGARKAAGSPGHPGRTRGRYRPRATWVPFGTTAGHPGPVRMPSSSSGPAAALLLRPSSRAQALAA